ncbi:hypothetical protein [Falsiroseomonas selenitidurans]|uniref:Uncharacterized protein n=1 Tax=Falsiroseomonas selenitidurans TaxID=2716335 RepID=A0ABX1DZZ1_9PROT|nr:hypothetical protein [Falsiroseomonas selenitidurans]NKC30396.1 hypothetical protein [Falsiroseomonas selenitidurans]
MQTLTGAGGIESYLFEAGDLVRLVRGEGGAVETVRAGDWGLVTRVHPCGALDIKLAGYSRGKDAVLTRAVAVPCGRVEPCDRRGMPLKRGFSAVWDTRKPR